MLTQKANPLEVIRTLHIIAHQTDEIFDRLLRTEFKLTVSRFRILLPLIEMGPATQAEVARFNLVTEASIGRQVRLLVEEGFIKRVPSKTDARKLTLILSKKTEQLLPRIKDRLRTEIETVYGGLSVEEFAGLSAILGKLYRLGTAYTSESQTCAL